MLEAHTWASQSDLPLTSVTSQNVLNFGIDLSFGIHMVRVESPPLWSGVGSVHLWSWRASGGWLCLGKSII